jgi:hypothetical protein
LRSRLAGCGSRVSFSISTDTLDFWVLLHPGGQRFRCPIRNYERYPLVTPGSFKGIERKTLILDVKRD